MDALIASIEAEFPSFGWLVRTTSEGEDRDRLGGSYFAHIHGQEIDPVSKHYYLESYTGAGETAFEALQRAYAAAKRAVVPA
jgi:hypothetical protein